MQWRVQDLTLWDVDWVFAPGPVSAVDRESECSVFKQAQ